MVFCEGLSGAVRLSLTGDPGLNPNRLGGRIWRLLPPAPPGLDALCEDLLQRFPDAPAAIVKSDGTEPR